MSETLKSLIRHILTAIGMILAALGLNQYVPIVEYLLSMLDSIGGAITLLVGVFLAIVGFFRNGDRFEVRRARK